jgi:dTDP-4-dehydrorhamnose reductase
MSTLKLSDLIIDVFVKEDNFGLFHIGGEPISKYDLLKKILTTYNHNCEISNKPEPILDLSLNQAKFKDLTGKSYFNHDTMLKELYVQYA